MALLSKSGNQPEGRDEARSKYEEPTTAERSFRHKGENKSYLIRLFLSYLISLINVETDFLIHT